MRLDDYQVHPIHLAEADNEEGIGNDLSKLKDDVKDIVERIRHMGSYASHTVGETTLNALEMFANGSRQQFEDYKNSLEDCIRIRPVTSIIVSFFTGLIISKLVSRS